MAPLRREWEQARRAAASARETAELRGATLETQRDRVAAAIAPFAERLSTVRVLDPACGSGNFLYVSLALLKGLEKEVLAYAGLHGVSLAPRVHPRQLLGIEINPYAHELASIVIWIGYLQWKHRNAIPLDDEEPILQRLDQVQQMDAIVARGPRGKLSEPEWPEVDVIVGNPPFLGAKKLRRELGHEYVEAMYGLWGSRVRGMADLCCYWHEKAREMVASGKAKRAGLLATQGIRGGGSRETLERIKDSGDIFFAESDRPWVLDGAAVHVAMVGFDDGSEDRRVLDSRLVETINSDLTSGADLTVAIRLPENARVAFVADVKAGPFDIEERVARWMLSQPNPDGRSNADVVRPWVNGDDITGRPRNMWIIDFPPGTPRKDAEL